MITALVVDDDPTLLDIAKVFIEDTGEIQVDSALSASEAFIKIASSRYDVIVSDYQMPEVDGIQFLKMLKGAGSNVPFILFTGKGREDVAIEALNSGADFYLQKGGDPKTQFAELINMMRRSVQQRFAQESVMESEEIFEKLFKDNDSIMLLVDPATAKIAEANAAACRFWGYSREEMLSLRVMDLANPDTDNVGDTIHHKTSKGTTFPTKARLKNGNRRDVEVSLGTIRVRGNDLGYSIIRDVTERKIAEKGLWRLNRSLEVVSESNRLMIHAADETSLLKGICDTVIRTGGYPFAWVGFADDGADKAVVPVAFAGNGETYLKDIKVTWDDGPTGRGPTGTAIRTGQVAVVRDTAGDEACRPWAEAARAYGYRCSVAIPMKCEGRVVGALGIYSIEDKFDDSELELLTGLGENLSFAINALRTARKDRNAVEQSEDKLQEAAGKMRAIINSSPLAIMSVDPNGTLSTWNPAAEKIFGWAEEDVNRPLPFLSPEDDDNEQIAVKILAGIALSDVEVRRRDHAGKEHFISLSTAPLVDAKGELTSIMAVASDITERKVMESRLVDLNEVLRLINGILRHDTLNELTVLSGSLEMFERTKEDRFLVTADRSVARSVDLIRSMKELETFALAGGALKPYSLREVAERVFRNYQIPHSVEGDATVMADEALASVIDNIVRNAIVHGKADNVAVNICVDDGGCMVTIADNGSGIPDNVKHRLFDEGFSHGPTGGSGLGLYLVRKAMERYGGSVLAEDNAPQGAVFVRRFPEMASS